MILRSTQLALAASELEQGLVLRLRRALPAGTLVSRLGNRLRAGLQFWPRRLRRTPID